MKEKKEKKKKAILEAAERIIAENGFRDMTMDQVAMEADVAKGTLYLYFKSKESLCAAVNAKINKEMNEVIKEKMDISHASSEKVVAAGTAVIEFSRKNPQKWKVIEELHQMEFEDPKDPNVLKFVHEVDNMVKMLAEAYEKGIDDGTMRKDIEPVSTAIFNRMAFSNVLNLTTEQKMLLKLNNISPERYLAVAWNLMNRSTHIKPAIREESDKPLEDQRSKEEIENEIKGMVDSLGLSAKNALEIHDAWETVANITMGNPEYEVIEANEDRVIVDIYDCPMFASLEETGSSGVGMPGGCPRYCTILVETMNPKYTQRFVKTMCEGDPYCESIVELKNK